MMPSAIHSSSFMSLLQNSSVSLFKSHDSITAPEGVVKVERFPVPLGKSQERLRAGECKLPEEKQQHWQEFSGFWFIPSVWQQFSRQYFNFSRWRLAQCRWKALAEASQEIILFCTVLPVPAERGSFSLHSKWWTVVLSIFCWVPYKHRLRADAEVSH